MKVLIFCFIIFSLNVLTINSNIVYPRTVSYDNDVEVIKAHAIVKRNITQVKQPDSEEQEDQEEEDKLPGVPLSIPTQRPEVIPCIPSLCGPYSQCQEVNGNARCTCLPNYSSSPPRCRLECSIDSECNEDMACFYNRCSDPCPGACGALAQCKVKNHLPICSCPPGWVGNPYRECSMQKSSFTGECLSGFERFNEECVEIDVQYTQ